MIIYKSYRQSCDGLIPVIHHSPFSLHLYYASFLNLIAKLGMPDSRQFILLWPSARCSVLCTDINCYKTHKPLLTTCAAFILTVVHMFQLFVGLFPNKRKQALHSQAYEDAIFHFWEGHQSFLLRRKLASVSESPFPTARWNSSSSGLHREGQVRLFSLPKERIAWQPLHQLIRLQQLLRKHVICLVSY